MSPSFEERLTALEARVAAEAELRAAFQRDLAIMFERQRAANHFLQALSITQGDHTRMLDQHTELLSSAHTKLDALIELVRASAAPE